mgnify:CR=1 FL=1
MKQLFPRGKRIRPTDKDPCVPYRPCRPVPCLPAGCPAVSYPANCRNQLAGSVPLPDNTGCKHPLSVIQYGRGRLVCLAAVLLFWRYRRDEVKQLIHRQKLARMVLENKWYESEQRKEDAFFKDLSSSRSKETITYFPKIYYRMKQGLLHIRVEITLGKYQEQLLHLEKSWKAACTVS